MLEVMNYDDASRKAALQEIHDNVKTDKSVNGLGNKIWLEDWYKKHPSDRLI